MPASLRISNVGSASNGKSVIALSGRFHGRMNRYLLVTNPAPSIRTFLETVRVIPVH